MWSRYLFQGTERSWTWTPWGTPDGSHSPPRGAARHCRRRPSATTCCPSSGTRSRPRAAPRAHKGTWSKNHACWCLTPQPSAPPRKPKTPVILLTSSPAKLTETNNLHNQTGSQGVAQAKRNWGVRRRRRPNKLSLIDLSCAIGTCWRKS